jgi:hypothetical protein
MQAVSYSKALSLHTASSFLPLIFLFFFFKSKFEFEKKNKKKSQEKDDACKTFPQTFLRIAENSAVLRESRKHTDSFQSH